MVRAAPQRARPWARKPRRELTWTPAQRAMVRKYVRKTPAACPEATREAITEFFRLRDGKLRAPLKNAAYGRCKEPTLCKYVKGHATAESALAALAARRKRGGQTCLSTEVEKALALIIVSC